MVNTAFTVNGEGREEVLDSASREKGSALVRSQTKYKVHSIDTLTGSAQTANNSTDTNALSAGADSPGEKGACSFSSGLQAYQHPLSPGLHLFIARIARSLSHQVLVG